MISLAENQIYFWEMFMTSILEAEANYHTHTHYITKILSRKAWYILKIYKRASKFKHLFYHHINDICYRL